MRTILILGSPLRRLQAAALALALAAGACGDAAAGEGELQVLATTTILGDVVAAVVGDDAEVTVLLPPGADPHSFQPSARQVAAIEEADLVVANGLGLEEGLAEALDGDHVVEVAPRLDPLPFGTAVSGTPDPHVWMDPLRMAEAARQIAAELTRVAPEVDWSARAEAYMAGLAEVDREITDLLAPIPPERRKLVTNHDSLGYFADRYGFEVVGTVIPGGATLAAPSAAELAALVEVIEREEVPAIFVETTESADLAEALAAEAGGVAVVELYSGALGEPGSGADTLAGMLVTNARRIAQALA